MAQTLPWAGSSCFGCFRCSYSCGWHPCWKMATKIPIITSRAVLDYRDPNSQPFFGQQCLKLQLCCWFKYSTWTETKIPKGMVILLVFMLITRLAFLSNLYLVYFSIWMCGCLWINMFCYYLSDLLQGSQDWPQYVSLNLQSVAFGTPLARNAGLGGRGNRRSDGRGRWAVTKHLV